MDTTTFANRLTALLDEFENSQKVDEPNWNELLQAVREASSEASDLQYLAGDVRTSVEEAQTNLSYAEDNAGSLQAAAEDVQYKLEQLDGIITDLVEKQGKAPQVESVL